MRVVLWIGFVLVVLGITSLLLPVPHTARQGVSVGGLSLGVETRTEEKLSPAISAVIIGAGIVAMIVSRRASS
jgi:hypothetical protein